jgi:hypothetical protein
MLLSIEGGIMHRKVGKIAGNDKFVSSHNALVSMQKMRYIGDTLVLPNELL